MGKEKTFPPLPTPWQTKVWIAFTLEAVYSILPSQHTALVFADAKQALGELFFFFPNALK